MCTLWLREKKQEMRLSVSMMQAFHSSYFLETIMVHSRLGTTACQARKTVERQQLGKDRLCRLPAAGRWWEEREQDVMWQRWRCSWVREKDTKGEVRIKGNVGMMWLSLVVHWVSRLSWGKLHFIWLFPPTSEQWRQTYCVGGFRDVKNVKQDVVE